MTIDKFEGQYAFLSNFYTSPISDGNKIFPTVEHYFQAAKTDDMRDYLAIQSALTPGISKRFGRKVKLRSDWEEIKDQVMLDAIRLKFNSQTTLALQLLATGKSELIEGTTWHDNYWGNCTCPKCAKIQGQNKLGKILMQVRDELMEELFPESSKSVLKNRFRIEVCEKQNCGSQRCDGSDEWIEGCNLYQEWLKSI